MPIGYTVRPERRLVVTVARGRVTFDDVADLADRMGKDPRVESSMRELVDLSGVSSLELHADELPRLAERSPFGRGARRAIIAPLDVTFGISRAYGAHQEATAAELEVFRTRSDALAWLGLEDRDVDGTAVDVEASD